MGMSKPVAFPSVHRNSVVKTLRRLAADSKNILITRHALERMQTRGITRTEVNRCLREGMQQGEVIATDTGDWQVELLHTVAGRRLIVQAVLTVQADCSVIVVTTWRIK